jgi:tetratricopeptide (TPR) repeat protein
MHPILIILIVGILYILIFGGISLIRREGLSSQFALEALGFTVLVALASLATGTPVDPLIFLIFLYLLTMRARLLVDLANIFSNRGRQRDAINLLQLAMRLFPDRSTRLVCLVNMGIVQLRRKNPQSAVEIFESVLKEADQGSLGLKYEAACRYNLGLALLQTGNEAGAVRQFNEAIATFPTSIYSRAATIALEKHRRAASPNPDKPSDSAEERPG